LWRNDTVWRLGENWLPINDLPDKVYWSLNKNGKFSTKSMYIFLEKTIAGANYKWIWSAKIPLKIKYSWGSCSRCNGDKI
jgi:hypothetical protein